jgi:hypothetical protein
MILRQRRRQKTASLEAFSQQYNEYGERTFFGDNLGHNLSHCLGDNLETLKKNEIIAQ